MTWTIRKSPLVLVLFLLLLAPSLRSLIFGPEPTQVPARSIVEDPDPF